MKKEKTNNHIIEPELLTQPLLQNDITMNNCRAMGGVKWHTLLRTIGPHLAGQGNIKGFLTWRESFMIKTLTKETLGNANLKGWRGMHPESKKNCYTFDYCIGPLDITIRCIGNPCCFPCGLAISPITIPAILLGSLVGIGRDCYNFSKKGIVLPLDDSKGIKLGLFAKRFISFTHETQVIENNNSRYDGPGYIKMS